MLEVELKVKIPTLDPVRAEARESQGHLPRAGP